MATDQSSNTTPPAGNGSKPDEKPAPKRRLRIIVGSVLVVLLVCLGAWWLMHLGQESTDDAQVDSDVVAVPARVGGVVEKVDFQENQVVAAGAVLAEIDPVLYEKKLAAADAQLADAKAAADKVEATVSTGIVSARAAVSAATSARDTASADLDRAKNLYAEHAITKVRLDAAQEAFDAADASLTQAKARYEAAIASVKGDEIAKQSGGGTAAPVLTEVAQAESHVQAAQAARDEAATELSWTKIVAPVEGIASKKTIVAGQMVQPGQPVVMIVPTHVWVTANFKETQLSSMKPGQSVEVSIDAYPGLKLHGHVESVSGATGARFSLLPPDNATGNFTKVVQRVPVRISIDDLPGDRVLRPGMSADVTVYVKG